MGVEDKAQEPRWLLYMDKISLWTAIAGGIGGILMVANIVANVTSRSIAGTPLPGTLDLSTYIWMPIITVLGMGYALQRGEHIRVSLLTAPASTVTRRIVEVASMVLTTIILAALFYYTLIGALSAARISETATATPWLEIWPMRFVVAAGILVFTLQALAEFYRAFAGAKIDDKDEVAV